MSRSSTKFVGFFTVSLLLVVLISWFGAQQPQYFNDEGTKAIVPMDQFSPQRAKEKLQQLYRGLQAHPTGTLANDKLKQALISELESLGYQTEQQNQFQCSPDMRCAYVSNLIAYLEKPTNKNAILINSHYDSVASGPGVGDNGVNVANALEIARYRKQVHGGNPIVLLFSDGEEIDLLGAEAFVKHPLAEQVAVVVNLEARGTNGRSLMFETSKGNSALIEIFANSFTQGKTNSIFQEIYKNLPNATDFSVFKREGITGYNFAFIGGLNHYHTDNDSLDKIDFNAMAEQGIVAANLIDSLAKVPSLQREMLRDSDKFYTDIAGVSVISWSSSLTMVLAVLTIIAIVYLVFGRFTQTHSAKRSITSALYQLLSIIITAGIGYGLTQQISSMQLQYTPWVYYDTEIQAVFWACTLLIGGLIYQWLTKHHSTYERLTGILLWFGLLLILFSFIAAGVSYLYLLPSIPTVLLLLWSQTKGQAQATLWQNLAAALFVLIYGILAIDIAYLIGLAIGLFAMGTGLSLFLVPLIAGLVTLARSSEVEHKLLQGGYGILAVIIVGGLWQISEPLTNMERQSANLLYFQQDDQAYWLVDRSMRRLSPQLKAQFEFSEHQEGMGLYPKFSYASVLTAEPFDYQEFSTFERQTLQDSKQLQLNFKKAESEHYYVRVNLPETLKYQTLMLNDEDITPSEPLRVNKNGYRQLTIYGHYQQQLQLTITYQHNTTDKPLIIDEERSQVYGFEHPKAQPLWSLYNQTYRSEHRGSRSIVRRKISIPE